LVRTGSTPGALVVSFRETVGSVYFATGGSGSGSEGVFNGRVPANPLSRGVRSLSVLSAYSSSSAP